MLVDKVAKFMIELGAGFSYVGKGLTIDVGGDEFEIDLLFYHVVLHRYIVIELKTGNFHPKDLGQLGFYMTAVGRGVPPSRPPPADAACAPFPRTMAFVFPNIAPCSAARCVLHYRRFRELMPPVGLYSESRPDGTHAWSAWDPLGPGSEILR